MDHEVSTKTSLMTILRGCMIPPLDLFYRNTSHWRGTPIRKKHILTVDFVVGKIRPPQLPSGALFYFFGGKGSLLHSTNHKKDADFFPWKSTGHLSPLFTCWGPLFTCWGPVFTCWDTPLQFLGYHGCCWETFYIFAYCGLVGNPLNSFFC